MNGYYSPAQASRRTACAEFRRGKSVAFGVGALGIESGSLAEKTGMKAGDHIVSVAGAPASAVSNVIAAQGQRNLSNSQAAINLTQARSAQIDNQLKSVNAYWQKQDI